MNEEFYSNRTGLIENKKAMERSAMNVITEYQSSEAYEEKNNSNGSECLETEVLHEEFSQLVKSPRPAQFEFKHEYKDKEEEEADSLFNSISESDNKKAEEEEEKENKNMNMLRNNNNRNDNIGVHNSDSRTSNGLKGKLKILSSKFECILGRKESRTRMGGGFISTRNYTAKEVNRFSTNSDTNDLSLSPQIHSQNADTHQTQNRISCIKDLGHTFNSLTSLHSFNSHCPYNSINQSRPKNNQVLSHPVPTSSSINSSYQNPNHLKSKVKFSPNNINTSVNSLYSLSSLRNSNTSNISNTVNSRHQINHKLNILNTSISPSPEKYTLNQSIQSPTMYYPAFFQTEHENFMSTRTLSPQDDGNKFFLIIFMLSE